MDLILDKLGKESPLTPKERSAFEKAFRTTKTYAADQDLIRVGEKATFVAALLEGNVGRQVTMLNGVRQIVALPLPGDTFEMHSPLLDQIDHSVCALTNCTLAIAPVDVFAALGEDHPRLGRLFRRNVMIELSISRQWVANLGGSSAYSRLSHLFCETFLRMADAGLVSGDACQFPLTQNRLAETSGVSNVHVNRVLQQLRDKKLITFKSGKLVILNWDGLQDAAGFKADYLHLHERYQPQTGPQPAVKLTTARSATGRA